MRTDSRVQCVGLLLHGNDDGVRLLGLGRGRGRDFCRRHWGDLLLDDHSFDDRPFLACFLDHPGLFDHNRLDGDLWLTAGSQNQGNDQGHQHHNRRLFLRNHFSSPLVSFQGIFLPMSIVQCCLFFLPSPPLYQIVLARPNLSDPTITDRRGAVISQRTYLPYGKKMTAKTTPLHCARKEATQRAHAVYDKCCTSSVRFFRRHPTTPGPLAGHRGRPGCGCPGSALPGCC